MPVRFSLYILANINSNFIRYKIFYVCSSCKRKCYDKISEEERLLIFNKFISFNTKNEQDGYLQGQISVVEIKQRRPRRPVSDTTRPSRGSSYEYNISTCSGKYQVCKLAFANIHGITIDRIRRLCSLLSQGKAPIDKRGLNTPGNAKDGALIQAVKQHIESFPQKISHYASQECHYLDARLNVKIMHSMFRAKHPYLDVKYSFYIKIFKEQFSLRFGRPQVDTCCTCEELEVKIKSKFLNDSAKRVAVAEKMVHLRRANKFYKKIKSVTELVQNESRKNGAICIDYMQNISLPFIPVQETFYLRQLTVSVCCIHNLKDNSAHFIVYHEGVGGKGPNEVSTFLHQYLKENMGDVEHLHVFTDGCGGQNKNHTIVRALSALVSLGMFKTIEQYFPIRGHSFLPCDRDFAVLKRKIRRTDRIYTVKEVAALILSSTAKNIFLVSLPSSYDIIDYKKWWPKFYKKNMLAVESAGRHIPKEQKVSFKISQYCYFRYSHERDGVVVVRDFIDGLIEHSFNLRNANKERLVLPTNKAYPEGQIPINKKKMEDLNKLKSYLPQDKEVQDFYEKIYAWPVTDRDTDETLA